MVIIEQKAKTITESCGEQKSALVNDSHVDVRMQMCDSVQDRRGCLLCCLGLMIERVRGKYLVYHLLRLRTCLTWNHCTPWGNALTSYQIEGGLRRTLLGDTGQRWLGHEYSFIMDSNSWGRER